METFIIAEVGINHNGDLELAKKMAKVAHECGVNAVKFQTFKASDFISDPNLSYTYKSQGEIITESQLDMFTRYEFNDEQWKELFKYCDELGIESFTTPQNISDLDFILDIKKLNLIKVGSDDLTNLPLLKYYASKKIPMIISSGMSYESEIRDAVDTIKNEGCDDLCVLHCVSSYPTEYQDVNMKKMLSIKEKFGVKVGFSDHTADHLSSIAAVSMGATVIEKHFTLDKTSPGPDHWFSSDPREMKVLVEHVRKIEKILGENKLIPTEKEVEMRKIARRSIVFKRNVKSGTVLTDEHFDFKRPGTGLSPKEVVNFLGKKINYDVDKGDLLKYNMTE
jgi:sialic acid synthase SpsE